MAEVAQPSSPTGYTSDLAEKFCCTTANNGNLASHVITHPGPTTYTHSFTYDGVNRLASASETSGFSRTYHYDAYGNRWVYSSTGLSFGDSHEPTDASNFSTSTNRLSVASSTYDSAGNQTYFAPYTLTIDAENRVTEAESGTSGNAYYAYDGDGRRVAKSWTPNGGSEVLTYFICGSGAAS